MVMNSDGKSDASPSIDFSRDSCDSAFGLVEGQKPRDGVSEEHRGTTVDQQDMAALGKTQVLRVRILLLS